MVLDGFRWSLFDLSIHRMLVGLDGRMGEPYVIDIGFPSIQRPTIPLEITIQNYTSTENTFPSIEIKWKP